MARSPGPVPVPEGGDRLSDAASRGGRPGRVRPRASVPIALGLIAGAVLAACGGDDSGTPTLTWYINPDNGGQADAGRRRAPRRPTGRTASRSSLLPNDADGQREQLVRRLAANDTSIDLMSLDPLFVPEFADGRLPAPVHRRRGRARSPTACSTAPWRVRHLGRTSWWPPPSGPTPSCSGTASRSPSRRDSTPRTEPVTWDQIIDAAEQTGTTVEVQGNRYEGYMVWINPSSPRPAAQVLDGRRGRRDATADARLRRRPHGGARSSQLGRLATSAAPSIVDRRSRRTPAPPSRPTPAASWSTGPTSTAPPQDGASTTARSTRPSSTTSAGPAYPRVDAGTDERAAARRHQPRHRRLQQAPGPRRRGRHVHHHRGEPDGRTCSVEGNPAPAVGGLRRPRGAARSSRWPT